MSMVHTNLPDARVLDLFAGSGALGLEALSRGAEWVDFVENDPRAFRVLQENTTALGAGARCAMHHEDAMAFLGRIPAPTGDTPRYGVAFADPPYRLHLATTLADLWLKQPFAAILGVEHESSEALPPGGDTRRYGDTSITIYRT